MQELLYPLGYLSSVAFTLRFLIQWLYSESKKKSLVNRPFWYLSLLGNSLLWIHSVIQLQFPMAFMQSINGVISWRNLDLMAGKRPASVKMVYLLFFLVLSVTFSIFFLNGSWFRIPNHGWQTEGVDIPFMWHIVGFFGIVLFNARFVIQWAFSEKHEESVLTPLFWWMSLLGGFFSILYFAYIRDIVNVLGPSLGMIPYIRNLMLMRKQKTVAET